MTVVGHRAVGPVPEQVDVAGETLRVERAWPDPAPLADGGLRVTVEALDRSGRVRAARLYLRAGPPEPARRAEGPGGGAPAGVARVEVCPPGADRKLPALARAAALGPVVAHRYGRRAVVRGPGSYLKAVRPGRAAQVRDQAERGRALAAAAGLDAPAVLSGTDDLVEFSVLPGRTLHDLGTGADLGRWRAWWGLWASAWPALAAGPPGTGWPVHDGACEADVLQQWADRADTFRTLPAAALWAYRRQVRTTVERLRTGPAQPLVPTHRDLHDKQLLVGPVGLGLLDFDTAALAEPALDLANLLVHIRLRVDQGLWSAEHGRAAEQAVLTVVAALRVSGARLACYAESTRLRLAALYSFRPRYRELAGRWAAGA